MTDNTINPAGFNQAGTMPNLSPEQIAKLKEAQAKKIEAIKKVKEMLEKTQKECEPFKKEILKKFKKEILSTSVFFLNFSSISPSSFKTIKTSNCFSFPVGGSKVIAKISFLNFFRISFLKGSHSFWVFSSISLTFFIASLFLA